MVVKCYHHDSGFCKFQEKCSLIHFEEVCRAPRCHNKRCQKRHPKPCRNFFLLNFCRFGQECKYDHYSSCEGCENLKSLIEKSEEAAKPIKSIENIKNELSEAKKVIKKLKDEKNAIVSELTSLKVDQMKKDATNKELKNENHRLKKAAENDLKVMKKASEKLSVNVSTIENENQHLKFNVNIAEKELKVLKKELETVKERENKMSIENKEIKAKAEGTKETSDTFSKEAYEKQLKIKDMEIKSLTLTRKVSVNSATKLQKINIQLENEIQYLNPRNPGYILQRQTLGGGWIPPPL